MITVRSKCSFAITLTRVFFLPSFFPGKKNSGEEDDEHLAVPGGEPIWIVEPGDKNWEGAEPCNLIN